MNEPTMTDRISPAVARQDWAKNFTDIRNSPGSEAFATRLAAEHEWGDDYYKFLWSFILSENFDCVDLLGVLPIEKFRPIANPQVFPEYTYDWAFRNARKRALFASPAGTVRLFAAPTNLVIEVDVQSRTRLFDACERDIAALFLFLRTRFLDSVKRVLSASLRPPQGPFEDNPLDESGTRFFERFDE